MNFNEPAQTVDVIFDDADVCFIRDLMILTISPWHGKFTSVIVNTNFTGIPGIIDADFWFTDADKYPKLPVATGDTMAQAVEKLRAKMEHVVLDGKFGFAVDRLSRYLEQSPENYTHDYAYFFGDCATV